MPMPFHCIECDNPISVAMHGLCDECKTKQKEEEE